MTSLYLTQAFWWNFRFRGLRLPNHSLLLFLLLFSFTFRPLANAQTANTPNVAGIVVAADGVPVPGTTVYGRAVPAGCRPLSQIFVACGFSVTTDSAGRFRAYSGGQTNICAQPAVPPQLEVCIPNPTTAADALNLRLVLGVGTLVRIEVEDQGQYIARGLKFNIGGLPYPKLLSPGSPSVLGQGGTPVVFASGVPPGKEVNIVFDSPLVVYDETNSRVSDANRLQFFVGSSAITVRLKAIAAVVNGASFWPGLPDDWGIATVFGKGIANVRGIVVADRLPLPTELAGTSVTVGGVPAPIYAVANVGGLEQVNFQAPINIPSADRTGVVVRSNGVEQYFPGGGRFNAGPGIFVSGSQPAIQHGSDFSLVTIGNPARRGETVVVYATGISSSNISAPVGAAMPPAPLFTCAYDPLVRIGGITAQTQFCGFAPGFVGVNQLNIEVPMTVPSGLVDLVICRVSCDNYPSNVVKFAVE